MPSIPTLFLYSTNVFMKFLIQERYQGGRHYVWCSEYFDPTKHGSYGGAYGIPASSNPAVLYRRYKEGLTSGDTHSALIGSQKASIKARAVEWLNEGKINRQDLEDIIVLVDKGRAEDWRPVIYVISRSLVASRLRRVVASQTAGTGMEHVIEDLTHDEFDLIEV